jgi:hypothetical protein
MAYELLLTDEAQAVLAAIPGGGDKLTFEQLALGDGGGSPISPDSTWTDLVNQVYIDDVDAVDTYPDGSDTIRAWNSVSAGEGPFTIREVGLFGPGTDGTTALLAIGSTPEIHKPDPDADGASVPILYECYIAVDNADDVTLTTDPAAIDATRKYVNDRTWIRSFDTVENAIDTLLSSSDPVPVKIAPSLVAPWAETSGYSTTLTPNLSCTDGRLVYVANISSASIEARSAEDLSSDWTYTGGSAIEAMCTDGVYVWIAFEKTGSNAFILAKLDSRDGSELNTYEIAVTSADAVTALQANGSDVFIAHQKTIYKFDVSGETTSNIGGTPDSEIVTAMALSEDRLAIGAQNGRVHIMTLDGSILISTYDESLSSPGILQLKADRDRVYVMTASPGSQADQVITSYLCAIGLRSSWEMTGGTQGAQIWENAEAPLEDIHWMDVDSRFLYVTANNRLRIYEKTTGELIYRGFSTGRAMPMSVHTHLWVSDAVTGNNDPTSTWHKIAIPRTAGLSLLYVPLPAQVELVGRLLQPVE